MFFITLKLTAYWIGWKSVFLSGRVFLRKWVINVKYVLLFCAEICLSLFSVSMVPVSYGSYNNLHSLLWVFPYFGSVIYRKSWHFIQIVTHYPGIIISPITFIILSVVFIIYSRFKAEKNPLRVEIKYWLIKRWTGKLIWGMLYLVSYQISYRSSVQLTTLFW